MINSVTQTGFICQLRFYLSHLIFFAVDRAVITERLNTFIIIA